MEIILFIIIIVFLIISNSKLNILTETVKNLNVTINKLNNDLERIRKEKTIIEDIKTDIKLEFKTEITKQEIINPKKVLDEVNEIKRKDEPDSVEISKDANEDVFAFHENTEQNSINSNKEIIVKEASKSFADIIQEKIEKFKIDNPDIEKFIGENLISKIGILILVLGVSFFVKYAIDNNWINEVARVGIGFLAGGILLGVAFKLQKKYKAFSSILVSGAFAIFYFIITYAFKEYQLFTQTTAFILLIIITIFSTLISILYDRKELGVLSLIGGFLVPILVSNGDGNYIVLFSYILILNIGFLVVSIKKNWFVINLLTFVFTHLFFLFWLYTDANLKTNASTLFLFASLFYIVFYLMNIYRVVKEKEYAMKPIVMSLFFVSTFVYFGQGLFLLNQFAIPFKGLFTLSLALINLTSGWVLYKRKIVDINTIYLFIGMTLTFLTLVGPIQLEGNYITLFWAAESSLLVWLSQKIKKNEFKVIALITTTLSLGSLLMDFEQIYFYSNNLPIIFNKGFVTGFFVVITLLLSAYLMHKESEKISIQGFSIESSKIKVALLVIGTFVLYLTGLLELSHQTVHYFDHYLSKTIIIIYNYIFIVVLLYISLKNRDKIINNFGMLIGVLSMFYGIFFIGRVPFQSFYASNLESLNNPTFYVQFILFFILLYILYLVYQSINDADKKENDYTIFKYLIPTLIVVLTSIELLILSQPILIDKGLSTFDLSQQDIINNSRTVVMKSSFPILWGVLSFVFLYFGIKKNKKEWRVFALVLIAITVIKLFMYDIGNVSQGGKIVAFIILGIVLLVISFMYQRIKKLFKDDDNKK